MSALRADHRILVIASDAFLAALIGSLVEATNFQAAFPIPGERPEEALARVRPLAAMLVDATTGEADSDLFIARARRRRIPVFLFGSRGAVGRRREWAETRSVPAFALPERVDELRAALDALLKPKRTGRARAERRAARAERSPAGTLLFYDEAGTRWSVYDRRGAERRAGFIERRFVSDSGERRSCDVPVAEQRSASVAILSAQLARARATRN